MKFFFIKFLLVFLIAGLSFLAGGGEGVVDGGVETSSGRLPQPTELRGSDEFCMNNVNS